MEFNTVFYVTLKRLGVLGVWRPMHIRLCIQLKSGEKDFLFPESIFIIQLGLLINRLPV